MAANFQTWVTFPKLKIRNILFLCLIVMASADQLNPKFYDSSCPRALNSIKTQVIAAVMKDLRMGASLLRLHFHDCFVQGCDASILLADTPTFTGEQNGPANADSIRGLDVIDNIKANLEKICPGVVSCADILAVAARDAVVALGGPSWNVDLGRRDSTTADLNAVNTDLPSPFMDLTGLTTSFANKNFTAKEMVALSGGHTFGKARCLFFRSRINEGDNIDPTYAKSLQLNCPTTGGDNNLSSFDSTTPNLFDNAYYVNLMMKRGLLESDQQLFNGGSTDPLVRDYAQKPSQFRRDFSNAMVKMSNLNPLTGTNGQIRKLCSKINSVDQLV